MNIRQIGKAFRVLDKEFPVGQRFAEKGARSGDPIYVVESHEGSSAVVREYTPKTNFPSVLISAHELHELYHPIGSLHERTRDAFLTVS